MVKQRKQNLWNIAAMIYVICNITFCAGNLVILNSLSMYIFLTISLWYIIRHRYIKVSSLYDMIILGIFGILLAISILYAPYSAYSKSFAQETLYDFITMLIILFCFSQYMRSPDEINKFWIATFIGGLTLSLYVFGMYGSDFWNILRANAVANSNNITRIGTGFVNTNTIGIYTSISMCLGIYYAIFNKETKNLAYKFIFLGGAFVSFIMAMASGSKKSFIIIFTFWISVFIYKQVGSKNLARGIKYIIIIIIAVFTMLYLIQNVTIFSGIATRMDSLFSFLEVGKGGVSEVERASFISEGIHYWLQSPICGNGLGSSVYYMGMYAHNNFVEILMSLGILGFIVFYSPIISAIKNYLMYKKRTRSEDELTVLGFALLITSFVCGIAAIYYFDRYWMVLIYSTIFMYRNYLYKH